ncbi:hypothetical protein TRFO_33876 [Tritrichomonas foetus]|uniref:Exportin-T n=1 Tax=Tritrichomonas foetus TaxID=1144522 RepID=A0A1J4JMF7_9EUKA|nr:hypothetical protein TRFO_33876 [Tritrichomonas foetus]|eukprot:OHS99615.1 hypothetical protein TRFO_33876 [Tritrichomonas foetus]
MTDYSHVDQQFLIVSTPQNAPNQQVLTQAIEFVNNFQQTPQCLEYVLMTYVQQQNPLIRMQQLIFLKKWCKFMWENMNQDIYNNLRELLFTEANHIMFKDNQVFINQVTDAQAMFIWRAFPDQWPTFWTDIFNKFQPDFVLCFIYAFTKYASILNGADNLVYNKIKNAMRSNSSDRNVAQFVINFMGKGNINAFEIFSSLCKWVNVDYILTNESIGAVLGALSNPSFSVHSLNIFTRLVQRGMPSDNKYSLIQNLNIPTIISSILNICQDPKIAQSAASLINAAGQEIINFQLVGPFAEMALNFLLHPNEDVSVLVIPFLLRLAKTNPQNSQTILEKALTKLDSYLVTSIENFGTIDKVDYLEQITNLTHIALTQDYPNNFAYMINQWGDGSIVNTNLPRACSIIHSIQDVLSSGEPKQMINEFVMRFFPIIQIEPDNPLQVFAIADFIRFFIAVGDNYQKEQVSAVFREVCRISMSPSITDEQVKNEISSMLITFIKKMNVKIEFDPQIIMVFVSTLNNQFVAAAGLLIRNLQVNQGPIFEECMKQLQIVLQQNQREDAIHVVLSFVRSLKYGKDAPHVQYVFNFLNSIKEMCAQNDSLLAFYIRTVYSSLAERGFRIIMECVNLCSGNQSITALCDAAQALLKSDGITKEWIKVFLVSLINPILDKFVSVQTWESESEENKEILSMTCSFIKLFGLTLSICPEFIDQNVYVRMSSFVAAALTHNFDQPDLVEQIIVYLGQLLKKNPEPVYTDLAIRSLNCLYSDKFDPQLKPWFRVCKRLSRLHQEMLKMNTEQAMITIQKSFGNFNAQQQHIEHYLNVLGLERPRDVTAQVRVFFIDFVKYKASIGQ